MKNGRCRVHGGKSTGPRTPEGLARSRRANWKHGRYSAEAEAERKAARAALRSLRVLLALEQKSSPGSIFVSGRHGVDFGPGGIEAASTTDGPAEAANIPGLFQTFGASTWPVYEGPRVPQCQEHAQRNRGTRWHECNRYRRSLWRGLVSRRALLTQLRQF